MQRIFFHTPFDRASRDMLAALPEDVLVFNAFDKTVDLPDIPIRALPLMIDKQLILLTEPPYYVGGSVLQFQAQTWEGILTELDHQFYLVINSEGFSEVAKGGLLEIELVATEPTAIEIEILAEGFMPWRRVIICEKLPLPPGP